MNSNELEKNTVCPVREACSHLIWLLPSQISEAIDPGWKISNDAKEISKEFKFSTFNKTISFVNAVAWIAESEDHHPDLTVKYGSCKVVYTTHAIGGLSENDFICAKKIDNILT